MTTDLKDLQGERIRESHRGNEKKEMFEAAVETPRRKDQVVFIEQLLPPKSFSSPPDFLRPPPEPPDCRRSALVPPRRASRLKTPFLGFPLCVDVFLTKQPPDPQKRPSPEPSDASSLTTVTGLIVKLFCVHIAELNVENVLEKVGSCGPLDQYLASTGKSRPFKDITIRVNPFQATTPRHASPYN